MSIWGKVIGGAAGLALGGPIGGMLGAGVGHMVDRSMREEGAADLDDAATRKVTFTIGVIALSAKMAKADGVVTQDEVEAFQQVFRVPAHEVKNVRRVYDLARQDTAGYEAYAKQLAKLFEGRRIVLEDLLESLFHIAKADGSVHPEELRYLKKVAEIFGFSEDEFDRLSSRHVGPDKNNPYTILGVDPDISDEELKQAYRQLIRDNHPDRLIAEGVPAEFIAVATDKLASINAAYERIAASRDLS